ncbi:MAG TPA: hypothetical protein VF911_14510 [Thermoanaerobaculia bacterium]
MAEENKPLETSLPELDERAIGKKYGLRELVYPDSEQMKSLSAFLADAVAKGKCGPLPKTAVMLFLEFLQGTLNRQHITKGPRMSQEEYVVLQTPYYLAARVIGKIQRARKEAAKGEVYQVTYASMNQFIEVLRSLLDPGCYWLRAKVPDGVKEVMSAMLDFLALYPDQRRKGRPLSKEG